jgi:hypothetical protein
MGAWYWIGVLAGVGVALGLVAAAIVPRWLIAAAIAVVAGIVVGFFVFAWPEAVAGGAGGGAGAFGAAAVVIGALARGGTRLGIALLVAAGALVVAALAFIPVVGYLLLVAAPALGFRLRSRLPERYAGLRTLARD